MKRTRTASKRTQTVATLARYEAMNPDALDAERRKFRDLAIRALKIELALQDRGFVEKDGWMVPAPVRGGTGPARPPARRKPRTRRPRPSR